MKSSSMTEEAQSYSETVSMENLFQWDQSRRAEIGSHRKDCESPADMITKAVTVKELELGVASTGLQE